MLWGVEMITDQEGLFQFVDEYLLKNGLAEAGDLVVVAAGAPAGRAGTTNMVQVHRVHGAEGEREASASLRGGRGQALSRSPIFFDA